MKIFKNTLKTIALVAIVFSCSNNPETSQEDEKLQLDSLKNEIEQLIATGICSENTDCDYIAFGSKPCGGPWSYLVYSTSINVEMLQQKVEFYNNKEQIFNLKWNVISDCSFAVPPTEVNCIDEICTAIY